MRGRAISWAERSSARFLFLTGLLLAACAPAAPALSYKSGEIVGSGWRGLEPPPGGWSEVLIVRAGDDPNAPPMLGAYHREGDRIVFTPRFAPSPGVKLRASFHPNLDKPPITAEFGEAAKALASTTRVTHIYPSADDWPANTLKMYVEFSAPMSAGEAWTHIRVLDDQGRAIEKPFVELEPELWDPSGKRLTVLFDPGRIKRGLVDNETSGPPLTPGRTVTIEIDPTWRDAGGAPLAEKFDRTIQVMDPLRQVVDVKRWRVVSPKAAREDVVVAFDRPLDEALARRAITVSKDGSAIAGKVSLDGNETEWRFTPDAPWTEGRHVIRVDGVIEDLAGNRLGKLFDVDTKDPAEATEATPVAEIAFDIPGR